MTCKDKLIENTKLINTIIKELNIEYSLEYMIENFKSIVLAVEKKRIRIAAVVKTEDKKTKRIYIKTISSNKLTEQEMSTQSSKCSIFIQLYRSINNLYDLIEIDIKLKTLNSELLRNINK